MLLPIEALHVRFAISELAATNIATFCFLQPTTFTIEPGGPVVWDLALPT